jgi:hypothetical protein
VIGFVGHNVAWAVAGLAVAFAGILLSVAWEQAKIIQGAQDPVDRRREIRADLGALYGGGDQIAKVVEQQLRELDDGRSTRTHFNAERGSDHFLWVREVEDFLTETPELGSAYVALFTSSADIPPIPPGPILKRMNATLQSIRVQQSRLEGFLREFGDM